MKGMIQTLKNHMVPHKGNDFKPHALKHEAMVLILVFLIALELLFLVQIFIVFNKTDLLASVLPAVLTSITNEERADNNVGPLEENSLLQKAAQLKADDMALRGYFSHTTPDGKLPWSFFDQVGYKYTYAGENLAVNFFDSKDVAEAWMNSPAHRANVVKSDFTQIGIGVANGIYQGRETVFVAEFFGTPVTEEKTPTLAKLPEKNVTTPEVRPIDTEVLGETTTKSVQNPVAKEKQSSFKLFLQKIIASPKENLIYIFGLVAAFILAVLLVIFVKKEARHPSLALRGLTVIAVILAILFINTKLFHLETNVGVGEAAPVSAVAY